MNWGDENHENLCHAVLATGTSTTQAVFRMKNTSDKLVSREHLANHRSLHRLKINLYIYFSCNHTLTKQNICGW